MNDLGKKIVAFLVAPLSVIPLIIVGAVCLNLISFLLNDSINFSSRGAMIIIALCFLNVLVAYPGLLFIGMPLYWILGRYNLLTLPCLLFLAAIIGLIIGKIIAGNGSEKIFLSVVGIMSSMTVACAYWFLMRK